MKKILSTLLLLLTSCSSPPPTVQDYIQHPKQLENAIKQCKTAYAKQGIMPSNCDVVAQAAEEIRRIAIELATDQHNFGAHILADQTQLAVLKQQLQQAQANHDIPKMKQLTETITALEAELSVRFAVIKLLTQPNG